MKKLTLMTTTILAAGFLAISSPASAAEQGWFDSMKQTVQGWFNKDEQATLDAQQNAEVEAYLDEVTVAVPPVMTGEEAAAIQPAAGDYVDSIETELNAPAAPGSLQYQGDQSMNTDFETNVGSSAAFGDPSDFNEIMPAAGDAEMASDAEEITDESIVIVEEEDEATTTTTTESETVIENDVPAEGGIQTEAETEAEIEMDTESDYELEIQPAQPIAPENDMSNSPVVGQ